MTSFLLIGAGFLPASANTLLTDCRSLVSRLTSESADSESFAITGKVLQVYRTSSATDFALEDLSGGALVTIFPSTDAHIVPGDVVQATGSLERYVSGRLGATCRHLNRLAHGPAPMPAPATIRDVLSGRHDWQLVRLRGIVRNVLPSEFSPNWLILMLSCDGISIHASTVRTPENESRLFALVEAVIDLDGICTPRDGSRRTRIGRILHFAGAESVHVVTPPPSDPFDVPTLDAIRDNSPAAVSTLGRHRVHGRVLAAWDGNTALLQTPSNEYVKVEFSPQTSCRASDFIDAVGLPESDLQHINLTAVTIRPGKPFAFTEYQPVRLDSAWPVGKRDMTRIANLHGRPVRVSGTLLTRPAANDPKKIFYLETNDGLFQVNASATPDLLSKLEPGSKLEATGICVLDLENWRPRQPFPQIKGFSIILRTPGDLRIVATSPWWTVGRLFAVIGTLLAILFGILIWNLALRHLAARKGRELFKEQLGHVKADLRTEERTRLAVELHDTLAQNLTGVSMEIEAANDLRGTAPKPMLEHLGIAAKALKSCRDELRNCLWDLRSQALEEPDMTTAILRTLQPHVNDSQLSVRFNVPRARLSDNTAHALLRVIRELVINAIRHGNASTVKVAGTIDQGRLLCSVADNGCGFDPDNVPGILQGHFGLQGIRERIDDLGGEFTITSRPGKGTRATITVPTPKETE